MAVLDPQVSFAIPRINPRDEAHDPRPAERHIREVSRHSVNPAIRPLTVVDRQRGSQRSSTTSSSTALRDGTMTTARSHPAPPTASHQQHEDAAYHRARRQAHNDLESQYETWYRQMEQRGRQHVQHGTRTAQPPATTHQHRVYLINCLSCGAFLTDRGMKAVLLLRPHITLFSTDAMPHCGPLHAPSRLAEPSMPSEPVVERTCDCLTQTLGCYGCGSAVGYHIVSPCLRCTSSVSKHQRSSNGHRTVLHCAEIAVRERRYVPGEPGVRVAPYQPRNKPDTGVQDTYTARPRSQPLQSTSPDDFSHGDYPTGDSDDDDDDDECFDDDENVDAYDKANQTDHLSGYENTHVPRAMKRGDVVYWSDLVSGGERSAPIDSDEILSMPVAGR